MFKPGDKIILISKDDDFLDKDLVIGKTYTFSHYAAGTTTLAVEGHRYGIRSEHFKLVENKRREYLPKWW